MTPLQLGSSRSQLSCYGGKELMYCSVFKEHPWAMHLTYMCTCSQNSRVDYLSSVSLGKRAHVCDGKVEVSL